MNKPKISEIVALVCVAMAIIFGAIAFFISPLELHIKIGGISLICFLIFYAAMEISKS